MFQIFKNIFSQSGGANLEAIINKGAYLVDVRTPSEFSQEHVKGSVNIPLDKIPTQLAKFKDKENIVVFCRSGSRSGQAKSILENNGFSNVVNGGTWQNVKQYVK
jgi:phage shock protein E